jgi:hypothetical protein
VVRWRPWHLLGETGLLSGLTLEAQEVDPPPELDCAAGVETDEASPATPPASAPTAASALSAKVAHLEPYIIPLDKEDGGAP